MQIHVVSPGDTLWNISNIYGVSVDKLINSNRIPNPNNLVVGQTIVIPYVGSFYWLEPGDSLYKVSSIYNIPVDDLIKVNNISDPYNLPFGYPIYIPSKRVIKEVGSYIDIMYQTSK